MKSHIGCVRQLNEDFYACTVDLNGRVLAIVADGMGGHQAGDVASKMAVERIVSELHGLGADTTAEDEREHLMRALIRANEEVYAYAESHPECNGMGTTVVATLISPDYGVTAHIGDSRLYHFHTGDLTQRTEDHSLVQELLRSGQITPQEAHLHPQRNVLMRALGTEPDALIDLGEFSWVEGDILLLCSDGLSNKVPEPIMVDLLGKPVPLQETVDALVQHALNAGGEDNITCIAVRNTGKPIEVSGEEG